MILAPKLKAKKLIQYYEKLIEAFESFKDEMNQKISYLAIENEILKQEIFQLAKGVYEKEQPVAYKNLDPNSSFFLSNLFLK